MITLGTKRPRNVDTPRAAAILYGDWGTSKAYVIGLAFAVAGYSSFWLILPMCVLTALVGINYMTICRHYPDGGGVYASVRHRSVMISLIGAFLLIADYLVTAAISAESAFLYLAQCFNISHPEYFAAGSIILIGVLNYFGPRSTGGLAFMVTIPTMIVVVLLGLFSLPHLGAAAHHVAPLTGGFWKNWTGFVGVVLALSGVEAIGNATGVMKLNPGATEENPCVSKTSTPAILWILLEVCILTALLGFAMHALPGLEITKDGDVDAPGHPGVRDYMLRYMGEIFVGGSLGPLAGTIAAWAVSLVIAFLLLSAVNTAIVDLIAIQFLMARDGELPSQFHKLNHYGVPPFGMVFATVIPAVMVLLVKDMAGLADLYAVGVVGAIAANLGSTSTDFKLKLAHWERVPMFFTFLVMTAIEISLFVDKPAARAFATSILLLGLILRGLAGEWVQKKKLEKAVGVPAGAASEVVRAEEKGEEMEWVPVTGVPLLCAVRGIGNTLKFAIDEAKETHAPLYLLFVREQPVIMKSDQRKKWQEDEEAAGIFSYAKIIAGRQPVFFCYAVSDSTAHTISDIAATIGASKVILGASQRGNLINMLRGNLIREVSRTLPEEIHLLVHA